MNDPLRIGLIGLDTSHVIAFTELLNDPNHAHHVPGARIVAGFPGGSPDFHLSASRLEGYTNDLRDRFAVQIMDSPAAVADAEQTQSVIRSVRITILGFKIDEVVGCTGDVVAIPGQEVCEDFGSIQSSPLHGVVGKAVELVPVEFMGREVVYPTLLQKLRQCSAVAENIRQPEMIHFYAKFLHEESLAVKYLPN